MNRAGSILKVEGGFIVEPGPSGRLTVWRARVPETMVAAKFSHG